jgi:small nuclear ribonucleoprotein B and B'
MTQKSKFLQWIDFRVRITILDGRMMVGTFMAYDKHMNVVLADTDEYRITKSKKTGVQKQIKRTLGLVIIRGENIVSLTA